MLTLFRDSACPVAPFLPRQAPGPDYDELASFLNNFLSPPDNFGEISINADEAQQLRRLGWSARAGMWRAPLIPWSSIAPYRLLWVLDDSIDPHGRPGPWRFPRAAFIRPSSSLDDLGKLDRRILKLLAKAPNHALSRVALQRRLWRIPASIFHHAVDRLISDDRIVAEADLLYPFSRRQFELQQEMTLRPSRQVPISTR